MSGKKEAHIFVIEAESWKLHVLKDALAVSETEIWWVKLQYFYHNPSLLHVLRKR